MFSLALEERDSALFTAGRGWGTVLCEHFHTRDITSAWKWPPALLASYRGAKDTQALQTFGNTVEGNLVLVSFCVNL